MGESMNRKLSLSILFGLILSTGLIFQNCGQMQSSNLTSSSTDNSVYDEEEIFALDQQELEGQADESFNTASITEADKQGPYSISFLGNARSGSYPGTAFMAGTGYRLQIKNSAGVVLSTLNSRVVKAIFNQPYINIDTDGNDATQEFIFRSRSGFRVIKITYNKNTDNTNYRWGVSIQLNISATHIAEAEILEATDNDPKLLKLGGQKIANINRTGSDVYHYHQKGQTHSKTCHADDKKLLKEDGNCVARRTEFTELNGQNLNGTFFRNWIPHKANNSNGKGAYGRRIAKECNQGYEKTPGRWHCLVADCPAASSKKMVNGVEQCHTIQHSCAQGQGRRVYDTANQRWFSDTRGDCNCQDTSATHFPGLNACLAATRSCGIKMDGDTLPGIQHLNPLTAEYGACQQGMFSSPIEGDFHGNDNRG